jgi:hypothetical protein
LRFFKSKDSHGEADDHEEEGNDDKGAPAACAVGSPGDDDGEDGRGDVDGHGEELGGAGLVAQVLDDGGQEEADAVQGTNDLFLVRLILFSNKEESGR